LVTLLQYLQKMHGMNNLKLDMSTYFEIQPVSTSVRYRLSCTVDTRRRRTGGWNRWGRLKN